MAKQKPTKPAGRPPGAKNIATVINVRPPACPHCGCTEKAYPGGRTVQEYRGVIDGQPFNYIVRRRTRCLGCQQMRIEQSFENELSEDSSPPAA